MAQNMIPFEEAKEQVALVCRRLGLLHLAFAETLVERFGHEEGKNILTEAIKEYGRRIGEKKRERAREQGKDFGPESFRTLSDLPSFGMHDRVEEVEVEGEKRIRAYGCVMGDLWGALGKSELGGCYCIVDPASSMAFNPDIKLVHVKAVPHGDPYCELALRRSTEEDRLEFAADDTDWSAIRTGEHKGED